LRVNKELKNLRKSKNSKFSAKNGFDAAFVNFFFILNCCQPTDLLRHSKMVASVDEGSNDV
jgi:hypothetical protein